MIPSSTTSLGILHDDVLDIDPTSLEPLSRTDKRMRALAMPHLVRNLNLIVIGNKPWERAAARMKTWNAYWAPFVRTCNIQLAYRYGEGDHGVFIGTLPEQLAAILTGLTHVTSIACSIDKSKQARFEEGFHSALALANQQMLSLKRLSGSAGHILLHLCPNVEHISNLGRSCWDPETHNVLSTLATHKILYGSDKIKHLEMNHQWCIADLRAVREAVPHASTLVLEGHIADYSTDIYKLFPVFASFSALEILGIMDLTALNVGFNPLRCGCEYMGPGRQELAAMFAQDAEGLRETISVAVFPACARLEELWIGSGFRVHADRHQDGTIKNIEYNFNARRSEE
ncbi:hypothetical protein C8J57DRAFT_1539126 [Mycena rebaudengoi]|nr:hypothetical protein C8J57DRAFT_1539126 [Mycena rebaudengoi]